MELIARWPCSRFWQRTVSNSVMITDASAESKVIYANKSFKKLTGHDPSSVIGKTPRILQGRGTDKKMIARLSNALKSGGKFEGKAINYKKDGTPFIMFWRVLPIKVGKPFSSASCGPRPTVGSTWPGRVLRTDPE